MTIEMLRAYEVTFYCHCGSLPAREIKAVNPKAALDQAMDAAQECEKCGAIEAWVDHAPLKPVKRR